MKKLPKVLALVLAGTLALSLSGCQDSSTESTTADGTTAADSVSVETDNDSGKGDPATGTTYQIGVLQLVQHAALDAANEGFVAALDDAGISYKLDQQNAAGEQSACQTIASSFVNNQKDLILAIATPAAQAVSGATNDIPVLITAVTDPAASNLAESNEAPGYNITGTSDLTPVKEQIELLTNLIPEAKKVGILYNSGEANSVIQAEMAREACTNAGLEVVDYTVSSSNEIQTVVETMVGNVDVIYAPTDNLIASAMATVGMVSADNKIPVICGEAGMVEAGGLATYGIDYFQLGYKTGLQAVKILTEGGNPATMPIEYLSIDQCELTVNQEMADELGIDLSVIEQ